MSISDYHGWLWRDHAKVDPWKTDHAPFASLWPTSHRVAQLRLGSRVQLGMGEDDRESGRLLNLILILLLCLFCEG